MPKSRPPYPPELRRRLVAMVHAGRSPASLAEEYEPTEQCIRNWVKQADRDGGKRQDGYGCQREIHRGAGCNRPGRDRGAQARRNRGQQPVMRISRTDTRRPSRRQAQDQQA